MRRVRVQPPISEYIGSRGLSRSMVIKIWACVHGEIAASYMERRRFRVPQDDRLYWHQFVIQDDDDSRHLFVFFIDDTTSPDDLILAQVHHTKR
jgi:hypothetical protein